MVNANNPTVGERAGYNNILQREENEEVVVIQADKNKQIVLCKCAKYCSAAKEYLPHTSPYKSEPFNGKRQCAALIKRLVTQSPELFDERTKSNLLRFNAQPESRHFCGLLKVHKAKEKWPNGWHTTVKAYMP